MTCRILILSLALAVPALADPIRGNASGTSTQVAVDSSGNLQMDVLDAPGAESSDGHQQVDISGPLTAFGELSVAEFTPLIQAHMAYLINSDIFLTDSVGTGVASYSRPFASLTTGASAGGEAEIQTRDYAKYATGQGLISRFTALFSDCSTLTAGSTAYAGLIDEEEGWAFGCNGTAFGILRRHSGAREIQTMTVTTKSTTGESLTVTLNGVNKTCAVTDASAGTTATTAAEIAACDYSATGAGWSAYNVGSTVVFIYDDIGDVTGGAFSITASTAQVSFAETRAGANPTNSWTAQTAWNIDTMDGDGDSANPSGQTLNETYGNVYGIRAQWLGFGAQTFYVENGLSTGSGPGELVPVHRIGYANANTTTSVQNPSFPLHAHVDNNGNAETVTLKIPSMVAGIEGKQQHLGPTGGTTARKTSIGATLTTVLALRNNLTFGGVVNKGPVHVTFCNVIGDHSATKPSAWKIVKNATIAGPPQWAAYSASTSTVSTASATASTITGGETVHAGGFGDVQRDSTPAGWAVVLSPGETLAAGCETASGTVDCDVSCTWDEHQ